MNAPLSLMTQAIVQAGGSGPVERIATTFGVNWSQLLAQIASFCIVCVILHRYGLSTNPQECWKYGREQIAQGLATTEQVKAELARTETQRQK